MASPFARTLRALEADRRAASIRAVLLVLTLLGAWAVWGALAEVTVYVQSQQARVEVAASTSPVHATRAGRLRRIEVALGDEVHAGQVLFVLDSAEAELELSELDAKVAGLEAQREMVHARLSVARAARLEGDALTAAIKAETRARVAELETQAELAERRLARSQRLQAEGIVDIEQLERDETEARRLRHGARALVEAQRKEVSSTGLGLRDRAATIAALEQELRALGSELRAQAVTRKRLEHQRGQLEITAPIGGRIGELTSLRPGSWIETGLELSRIVPHGKVEVVASFRAADAVGRVRPGQPARVRLDGFPWTEYGTIEAEVTTVAAQPRDGLVRVELAVAPEHPGIGVLQHAMPGQVEVAVEQVPPAILLLRSAGAWMSGAAAPTEVAAP